MLSRTGWATSTVTGRRATRRSGSVRIRRPIASTETGCCCWFCVACTISHTLPAALRVTHCTCQSPNTAVVRSGASVLAGGGAAGAAGGGGIGAWERWGVCAMAVPDSRISPSVRAVRPMLVLDMRSPLDDATALVSCPRSSWPLVTNAADKQATENLGWWCEPDRIFRLIRSTRVPTGPLGSISCSGSC
jgi:hypothetical protein